MESESINSGSPPENTAASPAPTQQNQSGKVKYRAKQSCIPCRTRKVKCDRIQPCQACCVRGLPSECEYVTSTEDRFLISQADAIESLRNEVSRLKQRLADMSLSPSRDTSLSNTPLGYTPPRAFLARPPSSPSMPTANVEFEKYAAMQDVLKAIASGPAEIAATVVAQVRNGAPLENIADLVKQISAVENVHRDQPGILRSPVYPSYSSRDPEYPNVKRMKTEPGTEPVMLKDGPDAFPVSPILPHPYGVPARTRPSAQWGVGSGWGFQGMPDDSQEEDGDFLPLFSNDLTSRKRPRSPITPPTRRISGRNAAMQVFLERLLDAFSPTAEGGWGASTTYRSAASIRMFSPILCDALEAVSLTYFAQSAQDHRLEAAAYTTYLSVLRNLQDALCDPEQSKSQAILLTVTVLMGFESIQRTTSGSIVNHGVGALRLIEYRGPHRHMYGIEHRFFIEFRPYLSSIAMVTRSPCFLSKEEWKVVPWSAGASVKDSLQYLLDVVVDIPGFLSQFDKFLESLNNEGLEYADVSATQSMLWAWAGELDSRLREWKTKWIDSEPDGPAKESASLAEDSDFPVFYSRNLDTNEIITPKPLVYSDLRHAQSMCLYYSAHLVLAAADTRPVGAIPLAEQYSDACNICRSMQFYIRTIPGGLVNRLAFPLRAAYDALPDGGIERRFVEDIFHLVESKFKLRLWGSMIPEISTRKRYLK